MKKQQYILLGGGIAVLIALFFFGRTVPVNKPASETMPAADHHTVNVDTLLSQAKQKLTPNQLSLVASLENGVTRGDVKNQQITAYQQLAHFWGDSVHHHPLGLYYFAEASKLENSEKSLTFAARLLLNELMAEGDPAMQNWMGTQAKTLFERSLEINPANDSARVGLGACYMFGNISDNPMQGILAVKQIVDKNPDFIYGQIILGLGDIKSGQNDKAIERFQIVAAKQPDNLEAVFHLAELYEQKGDKTNAAKWYKTAAEQVKVPQIKKEIEERIKALQ